MVDIRSDHLFDDGVDLVRTPRALLLFIERDQHVSGQGEYLTIGDVVLTLIERGEYEDWP